jgi:hypothetical protein
MDCPPSTDEVRVVLVVLVLASHRATVPRPGWSGERLPAETTCTRRAQSGRLRCATGAGYTGWHHHLGLDIIAVEAGSLGLWTRSAAPRPTGRDCQMGLC